MPLAALLAALLLAGDPIDSGPVVTAPPVGAPQAVPSQTQPVAAPSPATAAAAEDIPPGAPTDDYGFVAWCYGALGEYLDIYQTIKPELKDIDKRFGSSV